MQVKRGDKVRVCYRGGKDVYNGVIESVNPNRTFAVRYDDGDFEGQVKPEWIKEVIGTALEKGDRVMAFYRGDPNGQEYAGTVAKVLPNGKVAIDYDDGDKDEGIPSNMVRKVNEKAKNKEEARHQGQRLSPGDKVMCKYRGDLKGTEYPGQIVKVYGRKIDVDYDDGDKDRGIPIEAARLVKKQAGKRQQDGLETETLEEQETEKESRKNRSKSKQRQPAQQLEVGDMVMAKYQGNPNGKEYAGTITKVCSNGTYNIKYDDGDVDRDLALEFIRKLDEDSSKKKPTESSAAEKEEEEDHDQASESSEDENERGKTEAHASESDSDESSNDEEEAQVGLVSILRKKVQKGSIDLTKLKKSFKKGESVEHPGCIVKKEFQRILGAQLKMDLEKNQVTEVWKSFSREECSKLVDFSAFIKHVSKGADKNKSATNSKKKTVLISNAIYAGLVEAFKTQKNVRKVQGKILNEVEFAEWSKSALGKLSGNDVRECFDASGNGQVNGNWLVYFSLCSRLPVSSVELSKTLDECRKLVFPAPSKKSKKKRHHKDDSSSDEDESASMNKVALDMLKKLRKAFEAQDKEKTGFVDGKFGKAILLEHFKTLDKKYLETILKSITEKAFLPLEIRTSKKDDDSSSESSDDDDEGAGKGRRGSTPVNRRFAQFQKLRSTRFVGGTSEKFAYAHFLGLLSIPSLDENDQWKSYVLTGLLAANKFGIDWEKALLNDGPKKVSGVQLLETIIKTTGLPFTMEIISRILAAVDSASASKEVSMKKVVKWLVSQLPTEETVFNKAVKYLFTRLGKGKAGHKKLLEMVKGRRDEDDIVEEGKSGSDDESNGRSKKQVSRTLFWETMTEKHRVTNLFHLRIIVQHIDPQNSGKIDISSLARNDSNTGGGASSSSSESEDGESESESENQESDASSKNSDSDGDDKEEGKAGSDDEDEKRSLLISKKLGSKLVKGLQQEKGSAHLTKALNSYLEEECDDDVLQPEDLAKFLVSKKKAKLSKKEASIISQCFGDPVNIPAFVAFVCGCSLEPGFPKGSEECSEGFQKIVKGLKKIEATCMKGEHHTLLDSTKTIRSRVKAVLKAKAPKLAADKANIAAIIDKENGDEGRIIATLGKKYKINVPPDVRGELRKLENKEGFADGKKAISLVAKLATAKVNAKDIENLAVYFGGEAENASKISGERLALLIQPRVNQELVLTRFREIVQLCDRFGVPFSPERIGKSTIGHHKLIQVVIQCGLPISFQDICGIVHALDPKWSGKIPMSKLFVGTTSSSASDSDGGSDTSVQSNSTKNKKKQNQRSSSPRSSGSSSSENSETENESDDARSSSSDSNSESDDDNNTKRSKRTEKDLEKKTPTSNGNKGRWFSKLRGGKSKEDGPSSESESDGSSDESQRGGSAAAPIISSKLLKKLRDLGKRTNKSGTNTIELMESSLASFDKSGKGCVSNKDFSKVINKYNVATYIGNGKLLADIISLLTSDSKDVDYVGFLSLMRTIVSVEERETLNEIRRQYRDHGKPLEKLHKNFSMKKGNLKSPCLVKQKVFMDGVTKVGLKLSKVERRLLLALFESKKGGEDMVNAKLFLDTIDPEHAVNLKKLSEKLNKCFQVVEDRSMFKKDKELTGDEFCELLVNSLHFPLTESELCVIQDCLGWDRIVMGQALPVLKGKCHLELRMASDLEDSESDAKSDAESETSSPRKNKNRRHRRASDSDERRSDSSDGSLSESDDEKSTSSFSEEGSNNSAWESEEDDASLKSSDNDDDDNRRRKGKSSPKRRKSFAVKLDDDASYDKGIQRALKKAFEVIDEDRNGYLDQKELGRVMLAMNRECTENEIKTALRKGDKNKDGRLSCKEFVKLMIAMMKTQKGKLFPQREMDIRTTFEMMDLNNDGTVSMHEFEVALKKLAPGHKVKRASIKALMKVADTDHDGSISYDEFLELVRAVGGRGRNGAAKRKVEKLDRPTRALLQKIIRGPVPDPVEYLRTFSKMPSHFRPGLMQELDGAQQNSLESTLLSNSSGVTEEKKVQSLQLQVRLARGIPVIADDNMAEKVIERRARVCLWEQKDTEELLDSGSDKDVDDSDVSDNENINDRFSLKKVKNTRLDYVGNAYCVNAGWQKSEEDVWYFTKDDSNSTQLSTFVVRVPDNVVERCEVRGGKLCLLMELTMLVRTSNDTKVPPVEVGCGWASIELGRLEKASVDGKEVRAEVHGGTPQYPSDILDDEIKSRRTGWRALRRSFSVDKSVRPTVVVRCQSTNRSGSKFRRALSCLPTTIIVAHASLPLIMTYHEFKEATMDQGVSFEPVLRVFPLILREPELLIVLTRKWYSMNGSSIRNPLKRKDAFSKLVLSMWPLLCTVERREKQYKTIAASTMSPSARKFRKTSKATPELFFSNSPDLASEKLNRRTRRGSWISTGAAENNNDSDNDENQKGKAHMLFTPFNINETLC